MLGYDCVGQLKTALNLKSLLAKMIGIVRFRSNTRSKTDLHSWPSDMTRNVKPGKTAQLGDKGIIHQRKVVLNIPIRVVRTGTNQSEEGKPRSKVVRSRGYELGRLYRRC